MRPRRVTPAATTLLAVAALHGPGLPGPVAPDPSALPSAPRTEVGLGASGGEFWYLPACSNTFHRATFWEAQAHLRQRRDGMSLALEGAHMQANVMARPEPPPEMPPGNEPLPPDMRTKDGRSELTPGTSAWRTNSLLVARVGYHFRYGGGEIGPALLYFRAGRDYAGLLPSARLWAGSPQKVYVWTALLAEETAVPSRIIGAGLGHASANLRLTLGIGASAGNPGSLWGDALVRLPDGFWFGGGVQGSPPEAGGGRTWTATLRTTFEF